MIKKCIVAAVAAICLAALVLSMSGCDLLGMEDMTKNNGVKKNGLFAENQATQDTAPVKKPATLESLMVHLELVESAYAETYGADVDWDKSYGFVFASEEAMMNNEPPLAISPDGPVNDPAYQSLYMVKNFSSVSQWRSYLTQYLSEDIADGWIERGKYDVQEHFGNMYVIRGGRGYGAYWLDLTTARLVSGDAQQCVVEVDCLFFEEFDSVCRISFENLGDRWIVVDVQ